MACNVIEAICGADRAFVATLIDADGDTITTYLDGATLACTVWAGDDQAEAFTPTASWETTASTGRVLIEIDGADTADLAPGNYLIQLAITATTTAIRRIATLRLLAAPGSAEALTYYATAEDLRRLYPGIEDLQTEQDQAGWIEARAAAREWFDQLIYSHDTSSGGGPYTIGNNVYFGSRNRGGSRDTTLVDQLAADALVVTPPVRRCNALYALSLILQAQVSNDPKSPYQRLAWAFLAQAEELAKTLSVELDTDDDGITDRVINLGFVDRIRC